MSNSHNFEEMEVIESVANFEMLRKAKGYTQTRLAKELEIDQSAVSLWEAGKTFPRPELAMRAAKILGCTLDELFEAIRDSAPPPGE